MLITYLIFLITAIDFKIQHWPGASLLMVLSILFPFIGIVISLFKVKRDEGIHNVLKYVSVFLISLFLTFKFLFWPGSTLLFFTALIATMIYLFYAIRKKQFRSLSFYLVLALFAFATVNISLSRSSFTLLYMTEDPFNPDEPVPHFIIQRLAFDFYQEEKYDEAEKLIERNLVHIERLLRLRKEMGVDWWEEVDLENYKRTQNDYEHIKTRTWNSYVPLIPEDRDEP